MFIDILYSIILSTIIVFVAHYIYEQYLKDNKYNSRINLYNELNQLNVKVRNDILNETPKDKTNNLDLIKMKSDLKQHIKTII